MKVLKLLFAVLILLGFSTAVVAQEQRPYKEGPVVEISYIKVKPGKFDEYIKYLGGSYRALMEANKKAGLITSYAIYAARARTPQDADLILTITYPNMAALDRSEEADAVAAKVVGSFVTQDKGFIDRGALRDVLGSTVIRELILR